MFSCRAVSVNTCVVAVGAGGVYPGWVLGGYREGAIPGTNQGPADPFSLRISLRTQTQDQPQDQSQDP